MKNDVQVIISQAIKNVIQSREKKIAKFEPANSIQRKLIPLSSSSCIFFTIEKIQIITQLLEGEFPNYNQYIPEVSENVLKISREDFINSLKRALILTTQEYQGVKFQLLKDKLLITKSTPQIGELKEELNVEYKGKPLEIIFNPLYLIEVLRNLNDFEVKIELFSSEKPAVIRKENYIYLVLPRIS